MRNKIMHCDDKRMLYVLEQEIVSCWEKLEESDFQNESLLEELNNSITDYNDYKKSINEN